MDPEKFREIRELMETEVLEIMKSKKPRPESISKVKIGMDYIKAVTSGELQKLSAVVQVAGLYRPEERAEIAKKIVPPMYNIIDSDIQIVPANELKKLIEAKEEAFREAHEKREEAEHMQREIEDVQRETAKEVQILRNKMDDMKDEKRASEAPKLQELVKEEYQQKRDILK